MNYNFLPDAEAEYIEAVRFYEDQQAKLGESLISEFEKILALIIERPEVWRLVHPSGIRRIGLERFPYSVFYRVLSDGVIQITAFAHHRRRPGYWLTRIS